MRQARLKRAILKRLMIAQARKKTPKLLLEDAKIESTIDAIVLDYWSTKRTADQGPTPPSVSDLRNNYLKKASANLRRTLAIFGLQDEDDPANGMPDSRLREMIEYELTEHQDAEQDQGAEQDQDESAVRGVRQDPERRLREIVVGINDLIQALDRTAADLDRWQSADPENDPAAAALHEIHRMQTGAGGDFALNQYFADLAALWHEITGNKLGVSLSSATEEKPGGAPGGPGLRFFQFGQRIIGQRLSDSALRERIPARRETKKKQ